MGCDCVLNSNQSELGMHDMNLDLNNSQNNNNKIIKHSHSQIYSPSSNYPNKNNFLIGSQENSFQKGIDSSTKMNSGQPLNQQIQHTITIFTSSKIESFKQRLLKEINNARENPKSFIPKVKQLMNNITIKSNQIYLKVDYKTNIKLLTGRKAFEDCINYLNKQKPKNPLFLKDELSLNFPFESPLECENENILTKMLTEKDKEIKKEYMQIINFHYDVVIPNPELSVILQIIDDTNSKYQRRLNIFNEDATYIGISIGKKAEGIICFYLLFARDMD